MKNFNIWNNTEEVLETHEDERGKISDIFYDANINHVAMIESKAGSIRGNHYHKLTTQYVLVVKGEVEYWHKAHDSSEDAGYIHLMERDFVKSPPFEVHSFRMITDNQFIVFSEGLRGGKDYEKDTYRYENIVIE